MENLLAQIDHLFVGSQQRLIYSFAVCLIPIVSWVSSRIGHSINSIQNKI